VTGLDRNFVAGERHTLGSHRFEADAIIAFARKFDPQRFHVDPVAARDSIFGALCASGWHTTAVWMKKNLEYRPVIEERWKNEGLAIPEYGPSPGVRNLRWLRPVYAGDTITCFMTTTLLRDLPKRPGWNLLEHVGEAENQDGKPVLHFDSAVMMRLPE